MTVLCFVVAFIKRVIAHPTFHNVGYKECEKLLDELGEGECVIRPSSKVRTRAIVNWIQILFARRTQT